MKPVDIVLGMLTLCAVGMGVAAYRAWHPDSETAVSESSGDTLPSRSLAPADVARTLPTAAFQHGPHPSVVYKAECRNGLLYWHADLGVKPVEAQKNFPDAARCEIHAATPEEARRVSSADPSDQ